MHGKSLERSGLFLFSTLLIIALFIHLVHMNWGIKHKIVDI